jgi:hypothetical protein
MKDSNMVGLDVGKLPDMKIKAFHKMNYFPYEKCKS